MAVGPAQPPRPRRRWLDALFGEAFELEHRRRRSYLLAALLIAAAATAFTLGVRDGRPAGSATTASSHLSVKVSSATLPLRGGYHQLATAGERLIITGGGVDWITGTCSSTTVEAATLRVTSTARGSCANPALYGQRVLPVSYVARRRSPLFELALRIAIVTPRSRSAYRLGPVVLRYPQCSSCGIQSIYGDGSLWIYAPFSPSMRAGARSGELFRISERSGRVVQRWSMPSFARSLMATDDDGIWIAQSTFGGVPGHITANERVAYESLYRVAPGMRKPARELNLGNGGYWMVASRHTVWLDVATKGRDQPSSLWRLGGPSARPLDHRPVAAGFDCAEMGEGQPSTAGDARMGIYCVDTTETGGHIQGFDAVTGASRELAARALQLNSQQDFDGGPDPAVVLGRSVFFLVGENRLFRVATA